MGNVFALRPAIRPALQPSFPPVPSEELKGIDASEAATAVGLDPAKSQLALWRDKTQPAADAPEPASWATNSSRYWSTLLEPLVASVYTKRSGNTLRRVDLHVRHPTYAWMQAKVEWEGLGGPHADLMRYLSVNKETAPGWANGLPAHERLNALHLLAVTGKQAVDLAVLICGQELQIHRVERDEPTIARLCLLESRFWRGVEQNRPPAAKGLNALSRTRGATGGVASASP